eukprot:2479635-Rhodomonas_salina.1
MELMMVKGKRETGIMMFRGGRGRKPGRREGDVKVLSLSMHTRTPGYRVEIPTERRPGTGSTGYRNHPS